MLTLGQFLEEELKRLVGKDRGYASTANIEGHEVSVVHKRKRGLTNGGKYSTTVRVDGKLHVDHGKIEAKHGLAVAKFVKDSVHEFRNRVHPTQEVRQANDTQKLAIYKHDANKTARAEGGYVAPMRSVLGSQIGVKINTPANRAYHQPSGDVKRDDPKAYVEPTIAGKSWKDWWKKSAKKKKKGDKGEVKAGKIGIKASK